MLFFVEQSTRTEPMSVGQQQELPSTTVATPTGQPEAEPVDTSNWKVYTNEKYRFSLSYPDNWVQSELGINTSEFGYDYQGEGGGSNRIRQYSATVDWSRALLREAQLKEYAELYAYYPCRKREIMSILIGGNEGLLCGPGYINEFGFDFIRLDAFVRQGSEVLSISMMIRDELSQPEQDTYMRSFYQILRTVKLQK